MTGSTSSTIHSGRDFEWMKPWITFRRFESFFLICFERVARICSCSSATVAARSILPRASRTASPPILATNESSPYSSRAWRYSVSVRSCLISSGVLPGSTTM